MRKYSPHHGGETARLLEARKNVPGADGRPTQLPNEIEDVFPLLRGQRRHSAPYTETITIGHFNTLPVALEYSSITRKKTRHRRLPAGTRFTRNSALDPLANTPGLQDRLKALQIIQHQIWKPLAAVYRPGDTTGPHPFQIGDSVYVRRHQSRTLEPRWKGPYTVLLTTPTALKVDGIAAWVHASHVQRAPSTSTADASQDRPDEPLQWKLHRTQNPLKIRLSKIVQ
ncbi:unnamed protein product [Nyctereutes procyonoides]|uniref:(raccoon dog) hypothetical protein n=1 Tax=Nyctereutes procyonoides TaxID=34880 RepID=A0A811ZCP5_NYCPR|nr:unnamed protein product [Nyctereutes procyonoides]